MYKYRLFMRQNKESDCSLRCELIVGTCDPMRPRRVRDSLREHKQLDDGLFVKQANHSALVFFKHCY